MNNLTFSAFSYLLDDSLNVSEDQSSQRLFTTTLGKTEEIQIKFNSVKSLLLRGVDYNTRILKDFLPLIEAVHKLEQLIETYWIYFQEEDKGKLEEMAYFINKTYSNRGFYSNFKKILSKPQLILAGIKLAINHSTNLKVFSEFQSAQLSLAETILDLRDQDEHIKSEEKKIILSERDSQLLISLLENPPEPSEGLLSIFKDN